MRAPVLAVGDGALGFWGALREVFPATREQRCWFHKIANVLGALPKSAHPGAKKALAEIWKAEDTALNRQEQALSPVAPAPAYKRHIPPRPVCPGRRGCGPGRKAPGLTEIITRRREWPHRGARRTTLTPLTVVPASAPR